MADLQTGADRHPTEIEVQSNPIGVNPYFPEETVSPTEDTPEVPETDTEETVQATPEDGQETDVETPEPTFDVEADKAAGIDTEDANYKHYQAAFTRLRQKDKSVLEERIASLESRQKMSKVQEETAPEQGLPNTININWENFQTPRAPEESALTGLESEIGQMVQSYIQHAVNDIGAQQTVAIQQYQVQQAQSTISEFIGGLEPAKADEALGLLTDYKVVAQADPQKWIKLATNAMGLNAKPAEQAAQVQDNRRLIDKQRASTPKPSTGNGATPVAPKFKTVQEAVKWSIEQQ